MTAPTPVGGLTSQPVSLACCRRSLTPRFDSISLFQNTDDCVPLIAARCMHRQTSRLAHHESLGGEGHRLQRRGGGGGSSSCRHVCTVSVRSRSLRVVARSLRLRLMHENEICVRHRRFVPMQLQGDTIVRHNEPRCECARATLRVGGFGPALITLTLPLSMSRA